MKKGVSVTIVLKIYISKNANLINNQGRKKAGKIYYITASFSVIKT